MDDKAQCGHTTIKYRFREAADGTCSISWVCHGCGEAFIPARGHLGEVALACGCGPDSPAETVMARVSDGQDAVNVLIRYAVALAAFKGAKTNTRGVRQEACEILEAGHKEMQEHAERLLHEQMRRHFLAAMDAQGDK